MIIDMTRTKMERSISEALFNEQCGQIYRSLMKLADVQPVTEELDDCFDLATWGER